MFADLVQWLKTVPVIASLCGGRVRPHGLRLRGEDPPAVTVQRKYEYREYLTAGASEITESTFLLHVFGTCKEDVETIMTGIRSSCESFLSGVMGGSEVLGLFVDGISDQLDTSIHVPYGAVSITVIWR